MPEVKTPNGRFTGVRCGVKFVHGSAICDDATAALLAKRFGYQIIEQEAPASTPVLDVQATPAPRRRTRRKAEGNG